MKQECVKRRDALHAEAGKEYREVRNLLAASRLLLGVTLCTKKSKRDFSHPVGADIFIALLSHSYLIHFPLKINRGSAYH
jgi:hypothetical protein